MSKGNHKFYVYRIFDGYETVYVGKGSGRRLQSQMRYFSMSGEVLEHCTSDDHAFEREIHWIACLKPTANKLSGGNGNRCSPKPLSQEQQKSEREYKRFVKEYEEVGPKRYVARFLLSKLNETNCGIYGLSTIDISRLREVSSGCWR